MPDRSEEGWEGEEEEGWEEPSSLTHSSHDLVPPGPPPGPLDSSPKTTPRRNRNSDTVWATPDNLLPDLPDLPAPEPSLAEGVPDLLPDVDRLAGLVAGDVSSSGSSRATVAALSDEMGGPVLVASFEPGSARERQPWPALAKLWSGRVAVEIVQGRGMQWRALRGRETGPFATG